MKWYTETKEQNLVKSINANYPSISFGALNKLFRKKDIKVNGVRTSSNIRVYPGDKIEVYYDFEKQTINIERVYEDDNLVIVFKPAGIETCGEGSLESLLPSFFAVHRLDLNTEGLVIFAKNQKTKELLEDAFFNKYIHKKYLAWVFGSPYKNEIVHKGYLFKDAKKSQVYIYDTKKPNTKEILTIIKKVQGYNRTCLVEVEIPTGRTHQIRAVLSYLGMPIIGDEKYGKVDVNKALSLRRQCLTATDLSFDFPKTNLLSYLNGKTFSHQPSWIEKIDKNF